MRKVELHPAYWWICDECGYKSFAESRTPELTVDEVEEMRDEHGVQPWESGVWHVIPESVECPKCGAKFGVDLHTQMGGDDE